MAEGTERATFTRVREKVFVLVVVTANAGKAALERAVVQEFLEDPGNDWAQRAVFGLVIHGLAGDES